MFHRFLNVIKCFSVFIPVIILALLSAESASGNETDYNTRTIIIGGDAKYPPYEYLDETNLPAGFSVEISKALARVMGMKIDIRLSAWDIMRDSLDSGAIDLLQGMSYSRDRETVVDFSHPYTLIHHSVFIRKEISPVYSLDALKGKKVLVQKNGIMHDTIKARYPDIIPVPVDYQADALRQLSAGIYDYALVANLPGIHFIRNYDLSNIKPVGRPIAVQRYCYAVARGSNPTLLAQINEGLAILKRTGELDRIHEKWLGVLEPGRSFTTIIRIGSGLGIILIVGLLVMLLWSATLKKQVALRTKELAREIEAGRLAGLELESRRKQLIQADKMASLGYLIAGVAHEVNNPNGLIMMNIPVIADVYRDALPILETWYEQHGDFKLGGLFYSRMKNELPLLLSETSDASIQIKSIVEDLKDFGRQSDDGYVESSDINLLVANALRLVKKTVEKSTANFKVTYGETIPVIDVNPQRIEQVIINLVLNACQSLNDPAKGVFLSTGHNREANTVYFKVEDQGCGIQEADIPHITDPFYTTKRSQGGTGLGLSISAGIINANNGKIVFQSEPFKGTIATVSFPVVGNSGTHDFRD
jgi:polar amino acid transport system substrate-binding protein